MLGPPLAPKPPPLAPAAKEKLLSELSTVRTTAFAPVPPPGPEGTGLGAVRSSSPSRELLMLVACAQVRSSKPSQRCRSRSGTIITKRVFVGS